MRSQSVIVFPSTLVTPGEDFASKVFLFDPNILIGILDVTFSDGTAETLDVTLEEWNEATNEFFEFAAFTQATGVINERILVNEDLTAPFGGLIRAVYTFGGTVPEFTFSLAVHGKA
jgi:hypothetical protein